jgi:multicomponent Na+:H+ antiporter subunit G
MMTDLFLYLAALLLLVGSVFSLLAAIGIVRLPDLYTRMHAASKAGSVGAGFIFLSIMVGSFDGPIILRAIIGLIFLLLTTPVSAHLLARAAYMTGLKPTSLTVLNDLEQNPSN